MVKTTFFNNKVIPVLNSYIGNPFFLGITYRELYCEVSIFFSYFFRRALSFTFRIAIKIKPEVNKSLTYSFNHEY